MSADERYVVKPATGGGWLLHDLRQPVGQREVEGTTKATFALAQDEADDMNARWRDALGRIRRN